MIRLTVEQLSRRSQVFGRLHWPFTIVTLCPMLFTDKYEITSSLDMTSFSYSHPRRLPVYVYFHECTAVGLVHLGLVLSPSPDLSHDHVFLHHGCWICWTAHHPGCSEKIHLHLVNQFFHQTLDYDNSKAILTLL